MQNETKTDLKSSFFDYTVKNNQLNDYPLSQHKGQVTLVVNVASQCGFTKQYSGLQEVYEKFKDKGFTILGFPCNQFGSQEPGSNDEIQSFCSLKFNVQFPILNKIDVNGQKAEPAFEYLKSKAPGILGIEAIKWNFTKFLVDRKGHVIKRYAPTTEPADIASDIEEALKG